ncbi:hypothetical protein CJ030_MR8G012779 [Morella rubra]|uniref:Uncharacterized protein n=1 Tax=Morella rubra TaxID=262757 RepID=A0A6A1UYG8_9ROSI|nr:hypothetical protein CJ030_MR8G012779 [Morella rubra]
MKRAFMDSRQSRPIDEKARVQFKYQGLLQDYLDLQKEFVSKKKRLQAAKRRRENLLAEVRFLRQRQKYFLNLQPPKGEPEFAQQRTSDICNPLLACEKSYNVNEAVLNHRSPVLDMKLISNDEEQDSDRKEHIVGEPLRVKQKPKNYFIDSKRVGKKKISFQDQVALKV